MPLAGSGFWKRREAWRYSNFGTRTQRVGATLASSGGLSPKPRPLGGDFYLNDADGNGVELYYDRPRSQWPMRQGRLQDPIG